MLQQAWRKAPTCIWWHLYVFGISIYELIIVRHSGIYKILLQIVSHFMPMTHFVGTYTRYLYNSKYYRKEMQTLTSQNSWQSVVWPQKWCVFVHLVKAIDIEQNSSHHSCRGSQMWKGKKKKSISVHASSSSEKPI